MNVTSLSESGCKSCQTFIYDLLPSCVPICLSVCLLTSYSFHLCIYFSPPPPSCPLFSMASVPVVARATALTCRPMFPWARGPLGASQQASLPATSGAGRMERALISALKVNEAAARHSASDSWAPQTRTANTALERRSNSTTHRNNHCYKSPGLSAYPGCNSKLLLHFYPIQWWNQLGISKCPVFFRSQSVVWQAYFEKAQVCMITYFTGRKKNGLSQYLKASL